MLHIHVHSTYTYTLRSLVAYWFASASRETLRVSREQGDPARVIQIGSGPHDQVLATIKKMPFPLNNREFVGRVLCATDTNGDLLVTYVPVDDKIDDGMSARSVRGVTRARPEEMLAFLWDTMRRSARREDDMVKSVEEHANGHNMLVYNKKRTPKIIADRDFLGRVVWKKEGEGFLLVTSPEESETRPIKGGVVRGKYPSAIRIKRKNDEATNIEYVIHPDYGGGVPSFSMNETFFFLNWFGKVVFVVVFSVVGENG